MRDVLSLLFAASFFPLSCLIFDHRLWPDCKHLRIAKLRHDGVEGRDNAAAFNSLLAIMRPAVGNHWKFLDVDQIPKVACRRCGALHRHLYGSGEAVLCVEGTYPL